MVLLKIGDLEFRSEYFAAFSIHAGMDAFICDNSVHLFFLVCENPDFQSYCILAGRGARES